MTVVFSRTRVYPSLELGRSRAQKRGVSLGVQAIRGSRSTISGSDVGAQVHLSVLAQSAGQDAANGRDGVRLLERADGALSDTRGLLIKMQDLAKKASVGAASLDGEFQDLKTTINTIANETKYRGRTLLNGTWTGSLQVGLRSQTPDQLQVSLAAADASGLGVGSSSIGNAAAATTALTDITNALATLDDMRNQFSTHRTKLAGVIERQTAFQQIAEYEVAAENADAVTTRLEERNPPIARQASAPALGSNEPVVLPKDPDLQSVSRSYADIAALRDALERLKSALGTDKAADSSDVPARVQSSVAIELNGRVSSDRTIDADAEKRFLEVDKFESLAEGTARIQRSRISFAPDDRLIDFVDRADTSSALVRATLVDKDQRVRIEAEDPTEGLRVEDQGSGLLPALGIADGVNRSRTVDRGSLRSRKALADVAGALSRLIKPHAGDAPEVQGMSRLRSDIERAFQAAAGTEDRELHTDFGVSADFRGSASDTLTMTTKDFDQFVASFEDNDERVRAFFSTATQSGGSPLLSSLIARLATAESEVGRHLDRQFRLVDTRG